MRSNPVGYLSILGLIGVVGLLMGNNDLAGFGGFFCFLSAFYYRYDERVERNVNRACRNAFILVVAGLSAIMATLFYLITVLPYPQAFEFVPLGVVLLFGLTLLSFFLSYVYYRRKGD
jgi:hypothetical protein